MKRTLWLVLLYQVMRCIFFVMNHRMFQELEFSDLPMIFLHGVRFDLSAIAYLSAGYYAMYLIPSPLREKKWYRLTGGAVWLLPHLAGILFNMADAGYYPFTLKRTTWVFFKEFGEESRLLAQTGDFVRSFLPVSLFTVLMFIALIITYRLVRYPPANRQSMPTWKEIAIIPVFALLWLGAARGNYSFGGRPAGITQASLFVKHPQHSAIVLNTPFCMLSTIGSVAFPPVNYFKSLSDAAVYYQPVQAYEAAKPRFKNVVIILVESMSREFVASYHQRLPGFTGYMPFMDTLISNSLNCRYAYSNGKRSIEALPSVIASIPSGYEAYTLTPYANNHINSIANVLKKYGYHTSFYHGGHATTMNFAAFCRTAGFDETYSKDDYPNPAHYDGTWAIWDEEYLQYFAASLNRKKEPFLSVVFTATSHHPFRIPERYAGRFPKGTLAIHESIGYTDYALKRFFETAGKMPWYKNTLFIITADHAATQSAYPDMYYNPQGFFAVPLVFFTPDSSLRGTYEEVTQHTDIFPTVLHYLGVRDTIVAFGSSIFSASRRPVVVWFSGMFQVFEGDYLLQYDGNRAIGLYEFKTDPGLTRNLTNQLPEVRRRMELNARAFIQQYSTRIRQNKTLP
ncbi:MAG: LTA synthase family protein [Chitinophagales bacterium]|nr:LTA synthase family protein [Chitinophagales bacterium]MDW8419183.1 LTA synthase family protein [Chitinophagales bacterium]